MRNKQYWIDRANRRMDNYTLASFDTARTIQRSYNTLETYIKTEMAKILRHVGGEDTLAYEYRMKRLNALLLNAEKQYKEVYGIALNSATEFLKSIIPEAYYHTIFDIAQGTGVQPEFSAVPTRLIDKIINENWSGKNYSKRLWANTDKLAEELREVLTEAAVTGESIYKTSRKVAEKFDTASYNAERLIRTETTYATNQAETLAYDELDIDEYEFVATLDIRTSSICQKLDGKVFKTSEAQAGKNLPAMHPNCRSTTIPYFKDGMPTVRTARDKDGNRITVPANMKYDEWYKKYIEPYEGKKGTKKRTKGNNTIPRPEPQKTPVRVLERAPAEIDIPAPNVGEPEYRDTAIPKRSESYVEETGGFKQAKTIEEAEKFALENGVRHVNYSDLPLETANLLNEAAMTLPEDIRPAYIGSGKSVQKVTGKKFSRKEKDYYGVHMDVMQMHFGEYPNIEYDFEGGNVVGISTAYKTPEKIHKSKVEGNKAYAEKHDGHTQFFNEDGRSTAFHEMGHIYADKKGVPEGFTEDAERWLKESKCDMLKSTDEAWAEAWGAYHTKNPDLPGYIAEYVEKATNAPIRPRLLR